MPRTLEISREGRVLRLALNRPEKRNALNLELCTELLRALEEADADSTVGAVMLRGNGPAFCAGMDLTEILSPGDEEIARVHQALFTAGNRISKPIIAAVTGAALAGGTGLVANAHIVVSAEDATFGLTEIRIGLWPFLIFRAVSEAVGERRAVELALTGRVFGAREALELGLAHHLGTPQRAAEIAEAVSLSSAAAIQSGLRSVRETRGLPAAEASAIAARYRAAVFQSVEFHEGVRAFRGKRNQ